MFSRNVSKVTKNFETWNFVILFRNFHFLEEFLRFLGNKICNILNTDKNIKKNCKFYSPKILKIPLKNENS